MAARGTAAERPWPGPWPRGPSAQQQGPSRGTWIARHRQSTLRRAAEPSRWELGRPLRSCARGIPPGQPHGAHGTLGGHPRGSGLRCREWARRSRRRGPHPWRVGCIGTGCRHPGLGRRRRRLPEAPGHCREQPAGRGSQATLWKAPRWSGILVAAPGEMEGTGARTGVDAPIVHAAHGQRPASNGAAPRQPDNAWWRNFSLPEARDFPSRRSFKRRCPHHGLDDEQVQWPVRFVAAAVPGPSDSGPVLRAAWIQDCCVQRSGPVPGGRWRGKPDWVVTEHH